MPNASAMLTELRIAGLGVIDEVVIEPGPGFTAVTGETGAGKTMVVTGLSLLLGSRADPRLVRRDAPRALVEGRWRVDEAAATRVRDLGGELDDGEVIVARQVTAARSRAFVGGAGVPASACAELVADWATIHGQSDQVRLATPERQREVLDRFAGADLAALLAEYQRDYVERRAARDELAELTSQDQARARELDLLRFGIDEVAAVAPQAGEDDVLAAEARRLQAVDELRLAAGSALVAVAGSDDDPDAPSVLGGLGAARKALGGVVASDQTLAPLLERLTEAGFVLGDVAGDLSSYLADLDADPERLEWVAQRRAELQRLTRKYGSTVDEVLAWALEAGERAEALAGSDERIALLRQRDRDLTAALQERAGRLTALRRTAAARLKDLVAAELAALALPRATLEFVLGPADLGPWGADQVALLFSAHPAAEPGPLAKVASGGELSRVRLALEVVLAAGSSGQTFVFDEVDAGVGGAVALEIGRRLRRLAQHVQVIVVTHLAQVAAFADRHYVVQKTDQGLITTSGVAEVRGEQRQAELARMMAGLESTSSALAHAAELLAEVNA